MLALSVSLLLLQAGAPEAVPGPRLAKGDELHYLGEVVESSETVDNPFRKTHSLDVRLFILESDDTAAVGALLTILAREADPALAPAMTAIQRPGAKSVSHATAKLEFVRIDRRGRAEFLDPPGSSPLRLEKAQRRAVPAGSPETLPVSELGFLVPTPAEGANVGTAWQVGDARWNAQAHGTWNGRRCWEITGRRESPNHDRPDIAPKGWQTVTTMLASPVDGFASTVVRETVRRFGSEPVGKLTVKYELQPANRYVGTRFTEAKAEIETAWAMTAEFEASLASAKPHDHAARAVKIQRYLDDHPGSDGFRFAIHALQRRAEAMARGIVPFVNTPTGRVPKNTEPLQPGAAAPDFIATDVDLPGSRFRLNAAKGKPVVLVFFKPNSATSRDALTIAEALAKRFRDTAAVVPLAIGAKPEAAYPSSTAAKYGRRIASTRFRNSWSWTVRGSWIGRSRRASARKSGTS
jgi:hypothetical protein